MNVLSLLPFGLSGEDLITAMAALAAFGSVLAVWSALVQPEGIGARAKRLKQRREELKREWKTPKQHKLRRASAISMMKVINRRFSLLRNQAVDTVAVKLARAGWRSKDALIVFMFFKAAAPLAFAAVGLFMMYVLNIGHLPALAKSCVVLVAAIIGFYGPEIFVKNAIQKREKLLAKGLPDALDLLVICAEAGLSLDAAMTRVANEMERGCPEIAEEFGLTAVELGFLPERRQALDNFARRVQLASVRGVINTLLQTEKYGTPLANSLRVLSAEFRNERMMKAEEKAARLPAIMTIPMILFILPALFIVLVGPAVLRTIDTLSKF